VSRPWASNKTCLHRESPVSTFGRSTNAFQTVELVNLACCLRSCKAYLSFCFPSWWSICRYRNAADATWSGRSRFRYIWKFTCLHQCSGLLDRRCKPGNSWKLPPYAIALQIRGHKVHIYRFFAFQVERSSTVILPTLERECLCVHLTSRRDSTRFPSIKTNRAFPTWSPGATKGINLSPTANFAALSRCDGLQPAQNLNTSSPTA
jgi:hypothetical protein